MSFFYVTKVGNNGNVKNIVLSCNDDLNDKVIRTEKNKTLPPRKVTIDDICVRMRHQIGDCVEDDCSCDSQFMLSVTDEVGNAIRRAFHWLDKTL